MDRATSLYYDVIKEDFETRDLKYVLIPPGLTRFLQPLDISVNFPFKIALTNQYINFNIFKKLSDKAKHNDIINFIYDIWYSETEIKKETIVKSFKVAGITENFSQSKSKIKFKWPLEISPKVEIKEYLEKYLRNSEREILKKSSEVIKDDFADNNAEFSQKLMRYLEK